MQVTAGVTCWVCASSSLARLLASCLHLFIISLSVAKNHFFLFVAKIICSIPFCCCLNHIPKKHLASMLWTLILLSEQSRHWGTVTTGAPPLEAVVSIWPLLPLPLPSPLPLSLLPTDNGFLGGFSIIWVVAFTMWGVLEAAGDARLVILGERWNWWSHWIWVTWTCREKSKLEALGDTPLTQIFRDGVFKLSPNGHAWPPGPCLF